MEKDGPKKTKDKQEGGENTGKEIPWCTNDTRHGKRERISKQPRRGTVRNPKIITKEGERWRKAHGRKIACRPVKTAKKTKNCVQRVEQKEKDEKSRAD